MPKFHYDADELYPVLQLSDAQLFGIEPRDFTDEEVARIRAARAEFVACQKLIAERFGVGRPSTWWND